MVDRLPEVERIWRKVELISADFCGIRKELGRFSS